MAHDYQGYTQITAQNPQAALPSAIPPIPPAYAVNPLEVPPTMQMPMAPPPIPRTPIVQPKESPTDLLAQLANHSFSQITSGYINASKGKQRSALPKIQADVGTTDEYMMREFGILDPSRDADLDAHRAKIAAQRQKEGKPPKLEKPENNWGRLMEFVKDNPSFMLEMGAKLLAPRANNVSSLGHIATGLNSSVQNLQARKAASAKAGLDAQKTQAETGKLQSEIGEAPTKNALRVSQAYKNYKEANAGGKKAAQLQVIDALTESFWLTGKDTLYNNRAEAHIAASRTVIGHGSPEENNSYELARASTEGISATTTEILTRVSKIANKFNPSKQVKAIKVKKAKEAAANKLYKAYKKERPEASDNNLRAYVQQETGTLPTIALPVNKPKVKSSGEPDVPQEKPVSPLRARVLARKNKKAAEAAADAADKVKDTRRAEKNQIRRNAFVWNRGKLPTAAIAAVRVQKLEAAWDDLSQSHRHQAEQLFEKYEEAGLLN